MTKKVYLKKIIPNDASNGLAIIGDKKAQDIKVFRIFPYADASITQNTKTNSFNYASSEQTL